MSQYTPYPYSKKSSGEEKKEAGNGQYTAAGSNADRAAALPTTEPEAQSALLATAPTAQPKTGGGFVPRAAPQTPAMTLGRAHPMDMATEITRDQIDGAFPLPEESTSRFRFAAGQQARVTSTGFSTCGGLFLEKGAEDGGKDVGFSHINGEDPAGVGIDALITEMQGENADGLQAYLAHAVDKGDKNSLIAIVSLLQRRKVPLSGVGLMGGENLLATIGADSAPQLASSDDENISAELRWREKVMTDAHPAFDGRRAAMTEQATLKDDEYGRQRAMELVGENRVYPRVFQPGSHGDRWTPPNGLVFDPTACATEAKKDTTTQKDPDADGDGGGRNPIVTS